jgi:3',5'-cyclic AMP phosphodiesterase CpdA
MSAANRKAPSTPVRLVHLSDIHIGARASWRMGDWFSKRLTGWLNVRYGRGYRFRHAERVLAVLMQQVRQNPPDRIVFSGDATMLGFPEEFARAAELLGVDADNRLRGFAVPGNHDYYTRAAAASGQFEEFFRPWLAGRTVHELNGLYPFARPVGINDLWLVGLNSCTGNRWPWDAAGSVGEGQLSDLDKLLQGLEPGPRILVTHYPVCLSSGAPERPHHWLRDLDRLIEVAVRGGICLWLHGHRHHPYHLEAGRVAPFPIICAGSATQEGRWSYGEYTIQGQELHAVRHVYAPAAGAFQPAEEFELSLRCNP